MKNICRCMHCPKCKDRIRKAAERAGTKEKYVPRGRKIEQYALAKRQAKKLHKEQQAAAKAQAELEKEAKRAWRERRSFAFKRNVEKYGKKWARVIAVAIKKKVAKKRARDLEMKNAAE